MRKVKNVEIKAVYLKKGSNIKYQNKSEIIFVGDLWNNVENIKED